MTFDLVEQHRIALHGVRDFTDVSFELRGDRLGVIAGGKARNAIQERLDPECCDDAE
jgi:hypothetical protein